MSKFEPTHWEQATPDYEKGKKPKQSKIAKALSGIFKKQRQQDPDQSEPKEHWWQFGSSEVSGDDKTESIASRIVEFLKLSSLFEKEHTEEPELLSEQEADTEIEEQTVSVWDRIKSWRQSIRSNEEAAPTTTEPATNSGEDTTIGTVPIPEERVGSGINQVQRSDDEPKESENLFTESTEAQPGRISTLNHQTSTETPTPEAKPDLHEHYRKAYKKGYYRGAIKHGWKQRRKRKKSEKKLNKQIKSRDKQIESLKKTNDFLINQSAKEQRETAKPTKSVVSQPEKQFDARVPVEELSRKPLEIIEPVALVGAVIVAKELPPHPEITKPDTKPQPTIIIDQEIVIEAEIESKPVVEIKTHIESVQVFKVEAKEQTSSNNYRAIETKSPEKHAKSVEVKMAPMSPEYLKQMPPTAKQIPVTSQSKPTLADRSKTEVKKLNKRIKAVLSDDVSSNNVQTKASSSNWRLSLLIIAMVALILLIIKFS